MMAAPAVPLTTLQMSPTTSLQMLDTLDAFRISRMECLAPRNFREAMEWKGVSSAAVTAMPIISKTMPTAIMTMTTKKAHNGSTWANRLLESRSRSTDMENDRIMMKRDQKVCLRSSPASRLKGMDWIMALRCLSRCAMYLPSDFRFCKIHSRFIQWNRYEKCGMT